MAERKRRGLPLLRIRMRQLKRSILRKERVLRQSHAQAVLARTQFHDGEAAVLCRLRIGDHRAALHQRDDRTAQPRSFCHNASGNAGRRNRSDIEVLAPFAHRKGEACRFSGASSV